MALMLNFVLSKQDFEDCTEEKNAPSVCQGFF